jgi:hypothetical protein
LATAVAYSWFQLRLCGTNALSSHKRLKAVID